MQPCVFSKHKFLNRKVGWHRGGFSISYRKNQKEKINVETRAFDQMLQMNKSEGIEYDLGRADSDDEGGEKGPGSPTVVRKQTYTLTFKYTFEYDSDTVFFSHFYPYT
jgi:hypothetical protein